MTAVARALLREEPPPWVLDDAFAAPLAGNDGHDMRTRLLKAMPRENLLAFSRWVCVRTRWPEDIVQEAMESGVRQYVVLGAGLDSFAYRRRDLLARLRVFEVDHPEVQAWKRKRLRRMTIHVPEQLTFAPVDFEHQTLAQALHDARFNPAVPAGCSWIGVTMYLTLDAINATLSAISRCAPGTRVVLTYNQPKDALEGLAASVDEVLAAIAADVGEPFVSLFRPAEIEQLLRDHGFGDIVHFGPEDAIRTYFPARTDVQFPGAQLLVAGTVQPARRD
jgi:methyltransferase (TIGR00027 family)